MAIINYRIIMNGGTKMASHALVFFSMLQPITEQQLSLTILEKQL